MADKSAGGRAGQNGEGPKMPVFIALLIVIAIMMAASLFVLISSSGRSGAAGRLPGAAAGNRDVLIPLTDINDRSLHFYTYNSGGVEIKFFIVKDDNGTIRSAFDACSECAPARLGYSQAGDSVKCNNCGNTYLITDIGLPGLAGGCRPIYLPVEVNGSDIVIKKSDLDEGKRYFE